MAQQIVTHHADGARHATLVFTIAEFDGLLAFLSENDFPESQIAMVRNCGFIAPMQRSPAFEWVFEICKVEPDVAVLAICREGCLDALIKFTA